MRARPRAATADDLVAAADTLTEAFAHYPWTRHVVPEDDYAARLHALQLLYLQHALEHGVVAVAADGDAVVALLPPDAPEPASEVVERVVELHGDRVDRLEQRPAPAQAWRLETLGVRPARQGRGLASALLSHALAEVGRRGGHEVVLETSEPRNVRLYERHGFGVTGRTDGADAPPVWTMSTAPGAAQTSS